MHFIRAILGVPYFITERYNLEHSQQKHALLKKANIFIISDPEF
jgi:hypothetical protein